MPREEIGVGAAPDDGAGDPLRDAMIKVNNMTGNDLYRVATNVQIDEYALTGGNGSSSSPFKDYPDALSAITDATQAKPYACVFSSGQDYTGATLKNFVSLLGGGGRNSVLLTGPVTYSGQFIGELRTMTFEDDFTFSGFTNDFVNINDCNFRGNFSAISDVLPFEFFVIQGCAFIGTTTSFDGGIYIMNECFFSNLVLDTAVAKTTSLTATNCTVNGFTVNAGPGKAVSVTNTGVRYNAGATFNIDPAGSVILNLDIFSYNRMVKSGADLSDPNIMINITTDPTAVYESSDSTPTTAQTTLQADNDANPTNWTSTKEFAVPVVCPPGVYSIKTSANWSMDSTSKQALYQTTVNGTAIPSDTDFYAREAKDVDDKNDLYTESSYTHVGGEMDVSVNFLVSDAGPGTPTLTTNSCTVIVEYKRGL